MRLILCSYPYSTHRVAILKQYKKHSESNIHYSESIENYSESIENYSESIKKYSESIFRYFRSIFRCVRPGLSYHLAGMLGAVGTGDDLHQDTLGVGRHLTASDVVIADSGH